eukprot:GEMP01017795.1.p1 GENE.GEMP01017795.1~~GEMP01017795.1.p1  ORF type:complete len:609 (+),score=121.19 GEMP01017795.1:33-1829(+)
MKRKYSTSRGRESIVTAPESHKTAKRILLLNGDTITIPIDDATDIQALREAISRLLCVPVGRIQLFKGDQLLDHIPDGDEDLSVICSGSGAVVVVPWFQAPFHLDVMSGTRYNIGGPTHCFCAGTKCVYLWENNVLRQVCVTTGRTLWQMRIGEPRYLHWHDGNLYVARDLAVECHAAPEPNACGISAPSPSPTALRDGTADVRTNDDNGVDNQLDTDQLIRIFMAQEQPLVTARRPPPTPEEMLSDSGESQSAQVVYNEEAESVVSVSSSTQHERKRPDAHRKRQGSAHRRTVASESELWDLHNNGPARHAGSSSTATTASPSVRPSSGAGSGSPPQLEEGAISVADSTETLVRVLVAGDSDDDSYAADVERNSDGNSDGGETDECHVTNSESEEALEEVYNAVASFCLPGEEADVCVECMCANALTIFVGYRSGRVKQFSLKSHDVLTTFLGSVMGSVQRTLVTSNANVANGQAKDNIVVCFTPGDESCLHIYHEGTITHQKVMGHLWASCVAIHDAFVYVGTMSGRIGCYRLRPFEYIWSHDTQQTIRSLVVSSCGLFVYIGTDTEVVEVRASDGTFLRAWREKRGVKGLCIVGP